jgi:hypothetical protein
MEPQFANSGDNMKPFITRLLTTLAIAIAGLAVAAPANAAPVLKVKIPFAFTFGNKNFPAGDYSLAQPIRDFLVLRDSRGYPVGQVLIEGVGVHAPGVPPKLRFYSTGGSYILSEVWGQDDFIDHHIHNAPDISRIEKHHAAKACETAEDCNPSRLH